MNRVDTPELREVWILYSLEDLNPFPPFPSHLVAESRKFLGYQPIQLYWID